MGLVEILEAIRREGEEEIARIAAERDAAVAGVMQSAREHAKQAEALAAIARDEALSTDADVIRHRADLHVERRLQEAREGVFQEIVALAKDRLSRYRRDPHYAAMLEALLEECRVFLGDIEVVMADPRDSELVAGMVSGRDHVRIESTLECWGGVVAHDGKGVFVCNTLEERLSRAEADLRRRIGELVPGLGRGEPGGVS